VLFRTPVLSTATEDANMRNAIVVLLGALSLVACSKDKPADDANTTTTRSGATEQTAVTVEEVRSVLLDKRPEAAEAVNGLIITNESGIITLKGKVQDEAMHSDLVNRVRSMPNVRGVRDEIQVRPRSAAQPSDTAGNVGTTTTTGAQGGASNQQQGQQGTMGGDPSMGGSGMTQPGTMPKTEAVRQSMAKARPQSMTTIQSITITDDGSSITLTGMVPDEATHQALLKAARDTQGVQTVRDELKVQKKQ
jgi:osmotically-inducible protein OsmY